MSNPIFGIYQMQLAPNIFNHYRTKVETVHIRHNGIRIASMYHRFAQRMVDQDTILIGPATGIDERMLNAPLEVHACMVAVAALLFTSNKRMLIYEDQADVVVKPKAILQGTAIRYGVDVNAMAEQFPVARSYMGNKLLQIPNSLSAIIALIEAKDNVNLKRTMH